MIQIEQFESGHYEQSVGYKYFVPNHINDEWTWTDPTINHLLEKAAIKRVKCLLPLHQIIDNVLNVRC